MVITGESKGQKGRVLEVNREKERALVEGVNMVSKHTKPNAKAPQGGITEKGSTRSICQTLCLLIPLQENPHVSEENLMIKINWCAIQKNQERRLSNVYTCTENKV